MAVEVRQFGVQARELQLRRGRKPIHRAQEDAGASAVHGHGNGRMSFRLDFIFNRADEDRVFNYAVDAAPGGEVSANSLGRHVLNLLGGGWTREKRRADCQNEEGRDSGVRNRSRATKSAVKRPGMEKQPHSLTVPQNYCDWGRRGELRGRTDGCYKGRGF